MHPQLNWIERRSTEPKVWSSNLYGCAIFLPKTVCFGLFFTHFQNYTYLDFAVLTSWVRTKCIFFYSINTKSAKRQKRLVLTPVLTQRAFSVLKPKNFTIFFYFEIFLFIFSNRKDGIIFRYRLSIYYSVLFCFISEIFFDRSKTECFHFFNFLL